MVFIRSSVSMCDMICSIFLLSSYDSVHTFVLPPPLGIAVPRENWVNAIDLFCWQLS